MPRFVVLREGQIVEGFTIDSDDMLIGRLPDADIQLASPSVSRRHARIRRVGTGHVIEDFASLNGFAVAGKRVNRHELQPGDRVTIEEYTLVYEPTADIYAAGHAASMGRVKKDGELDRTSLNLRKTEDGSYESD